MSAADDLKAADPTSGWVDQGLVLQSIESDDFNAIDPNLVIENPEKVFSRQQLLEAVWPHSDEIELRTVDVHVRRLRMALAGEARQELIRTVRSEGYSLDSSGQD